MLLLNAENRLLLGDLLRAGGYAVTNEFPSSSVGLGHAGSIDLCVVDGPSLDRHWAELRAAQVAQQPVPVPVLLMTGRDDVGLATRDLWHVVDDVVHRPVDKVALRARIETLIRGRRLALRVRELSRLYENERRVARRFQEAAMPRALPVVPGLRFAAVYRPATREDRVGGDWYDAARLPDGRVVISIGAVCGFGLDAAVAMANVRQVVRGVAQVHPDPATMLDAADRTLHAEDKERIVTAFVGVFDPVTSSLAYASAGHPRPLLRLADGTLER
ncbi:MAG: SpoIIE family protein phosphatase [Candidatus Eremiobacteraeota bacterium]|nr:SpoIIE family protein phosphatase [Candidatus Eremiobacteraeota bacterium]